MRYQITDFKNNISNLDWSAQELADKLSAIGHETEAQGSEVDVTLTTNRQDCKALNVLCYDLAGCYDLAFTGEKPDITPTKTIAVTINDVNRTLGTQLEQAELTKLSRLGFTIESGSVIVPAYRTDLAGIADIAEEVARLIGFNSITPQPTETTSTSPNQVYYHKLSIKIALAELGLSEVLTYSFDTKKTSWELERPFNNDEPYLRESLLHGLLKVAAKSPYLKRGAIFEVGQVFRKNEEEMLGILIFGYKDKAREQLVEQIKTAIKPKFKLELIHIDQAELSTFEVSQPNVYFAELSVGECGVSSEPVSLQDTLHPLLPVSKFPPTVRDVTLTGTRQAVEQKIANFKNDYLLFSELVDAFQKETGETSYTYRFFFQDVDQPFTEAQIAEKIDQPLQQAFEHNQ